MSCEKCGDKGAYGVTEPAERRALPNGDVIVSGPSYSTHLCACRKSLPPREGIAQWWSLEPVCREDIAIPIFDEQVSIRVEAEVPIDAENFRVHRRGNRYYPTLINIEAPQAMTLHADTARTLARALVAAAEAAEKIDDADTDPKCGHWVPCDCELSTGAAEGAGDV